MPRIGRPLVVVLALVLPLAACGDDAGSSEADPVRTYTLHLKADERGDEYVFVATDTPDLRVGDRVTFEVLNAGALPHDLAVIHPDGSTIATAPAAAPGGTTSVEVDLVDPGYYRLNCNVDDHLTVHGMQAFVEVVDPAAPDPAVTATSG